MRDTRTRARGAEAIVHGLLAYLANRARAVHDPIRLDEVNRLREVLVVGCGGHIYPQDPETVGHIYEFYRASAEEFRDLLCRTQRGVLERIAMMQGGGS